MEIDKLKNIPHLELNEFLKTLEVKITSNFQQFQQSTFSEGFWRKVSEYILYPICVHISSVLMILNSTVGIKDAQFWFPACSFEHT